MHTKVSFATDERCLDNPFYMPENTIWQPNGPSNELMANQDSVSQYIPTDIQLFSSREEEQQDLRCHSIIELAIFPSRHLSIMG